jgi:excisionase family DNA binding protein
VNTRKILTPAEAAALFRVDPKTVTRWAKAEKIPYFTTLGGHRRFYEDEILEIRGTFGRLMPEEVA